MAGAERRRFNVTLPADIEGLFDWYLENDARFIGKGGATVAAFFLELGLRAAYEKGLREADGAPSEEFESLAAHQSAIFNSVDD